MSEDRIYLKIQSPTKVEFATRQTRQGKTEVTVSINPDRYGNYYARVLVSRVDGIDLGTISGHLRLPYITTGYVNREVVFKNTCKGDIYVMITPDVEWDFTNYDIEGDWDLGILPKIPRACLFPQHDRRF